MSSKRRGHPKGEIEILNACLEENIQAARKFLERNQAGIIRGAHLIAGALRRGRKLLICGNGGSAADSQHIAAEFVGNFSHVRPGLPAIALSADSATITSLGNDFGFEWIFARQVEALGVPGDVLIVITTSGQSRNILRAVEEARKKRMTVLALAGKGGGRLRKLAPDMLLVPARSTPRIQEVFMLVIHAICALVEARLFPGLSESKPGSGAIPSARRSA